ncbi:MAG: phosphoribosylglycinamide formyltransferase [Myxococcota bacterium]
MTRFGVLISGRGSNLRAILDFWERAPAGLPVRESAPAVVISNRPGAGGLAHAREAGVPAEVVDHRAFDERRAFEEAVTAILDRHEVEWIVLAGFMRLLTAWFVGRYRDRILNTHPALLPAFPGHDATAQAIAAGVKVSGCTIHLVDEGMDSGPIVAQSAVPVLETDTPDVLGERIRRVEHAIYPKVVAKMVAGRFRRDGRLVHLEGGGP